MILSVPLREASYNKGACLETVNDRNFVKYNISRILSLMVWLSVKQLRPSLILWFIQYFLTYEV